MHQLTSFPHMAPTGVQLSMGIFRCVVHLCPPPPPGDRHFHVFLVNMYCAGLCCPTALRMALHCFPSTTNQAPVYVL